MKYLLILLLICTSCVTQKACFEKFPPQETTTITYRDTVYFFRTDTDTIWASASWMDTVNVASGQIIGSAWVARDSIYIKVIQRDTVFTVRDSVRVETVTEVVQLPPEYSGKMWQWIILASILLVIIIFIIFRR
jgi:hypothetical protein